MNTVWEGWTGTPAQLAYRTLDHIREDPESWEQVEWVSPCGTRACFAGWAVQLAGCPVDPNTELTWGPTGTMYSIQGYAREILGLSFDDACDLFESENTLEDLENYVDKIFGPRVDAT